jgi:hypothetical protein
MRDNSRDLDQTSKRVLGFTGFVNGRRETEVVERTILDKFSSISEILSDEQRGAPQERPPFSDFKENGHIRLQGDMDDSMEEKINSTQSKVKASSLSREWSDNAVALSSRSNPSTNEVLYAENLVGSNINGNILGKEAQQFSLYTSDTESNLSHVNISESPEAKELNAKTSLTLKNLSECHASEESKKVLVPRSSESKTDSTNFRNKLLQNEYTRTLPQWKVQAPIEIMDQVDQKSIPDSPRYHTSKIRRLGLRNENFECDRKDSTVKNDTPDLSLRDSRFFRSGNEQLSTPHSKVPQLLRSSPEGETDIRDIPHRNFMKSPFSKNQGGRRLSETFAANFEVSEQNSIQTSVKRKGDD